MEINSPFGPSTSMAGQDKTREKQPATSFQDTLLAASQSGKKSASATGEVSDSQKIYKEIVDAGFGKWVQEMRKEELEKKLRAQILESLGISEEELGYMPADKIAAIEQMIQNLMQELMANSGQDKGKEQLEKGQIYVPVIPGTVA